MNQLMLTQSNLEAIHLKVEAFNKNIEVSHWDIESLNNNIEAYEEN